MNLTLPPYTKNKYLISVVAFIAWLIFFDKNDMHSQFQLRDEVAKLEVEKAYYLHEITQNKYLYTGLLKDPKVLEKFAREKYLMKKDNEAVFVVVQK